MSDIGEIISLYEKARSRIVEEEKLLFRQLGRDVDSDLLKIVDFETETEYPGPEEYYTYRKLRGTGINPAYLCIEEVNLLVMDKALSLKPDGNVSKEDYINALREAYREVGHERMRILQGLDDTGLELFKASISRHGYNDKETMLLFDLYRRFYEFVTFSSSTGGE